MAPDTKTDKAEGGALENPSRRKFLFDFFIVLVASLCKVSIEGDKSERNIKQISEFLKGNTEYRIEFFGQQMSRGELVDFIYNTFNLKYPDAINRQDVDDLISYFGFVLLRDNVYESNFNINSLLEKISLFVSSSSSHTYGPGQMSAGTAIMVHKKFYENMLSVATETCHNIDFLSPEDIGKTTKDIVRKLDLTGDGSVVYSLLNFIDSYLFYRNIEEEFDLKSFLLAISARVGGTYHPVQYKTNVLKSELGKVGVVCKADDIAEEWDKNIGLKLDEYIEGNFVDILKSRFLTMRGLCVYLIRDESCLGESEKDRLLKLYMKYIKNRDKRVFDFLLYLYTKDKYKEEINKIIIENIKTENTYKGFVPVIYKGQEMLGVKDSINILYKIEMIIIDMYRSVSASDSK